MHPVSMEEKGVVQGKPSAEPFMIILYKTRLHSVMVYNIHVYVFVDTCLFSIYHRSVRISCFILATITTP